MRGYEAYSRGTLGRNEATGTDLIERDREGGEEGVASYR